MSDLPDTISYLLAIAENGGPNWRVQATAAIDAFIVGAGITAARPRLLEEFTSVNPGTARSNDTQDMIDDPKAERHIRVTTA